MANLIVKKLIKLPIGTAVELTYDEGNVSNQKIIGVVTDNDGEENLEIRLENGEELIVNYSLVRSFKAVGASPAPAPAPVPGPAPKPAPVPVPVPKPKARTPLYEREPADTLNRNDHELKLLFDVFPAGDKKLLSGVYDSFKHGIRVNDRSKMSAAANQARQILFLEDDKRYYWSDEAVDFCAALLRRVAVYDSEVFLIADRFREAALCAVKTQEYQQAGVYAITALLEKDPPYVQDLFAILAKAVVKTGDISGLKLLLRYLPEQMEPMARELLADLFEAKGMKVGTDRNRETELQLLQTLYTGEGMGAEAAKWLPEDLVKAERQRSMPAAAVPAPVQKQEIKPEPMWGVLTRADWSSHTGIIRGDDGRDYTFRYEDLANAEMEKEIRQSMRADLGGKVYDVKFLASGKTAANVLPNREFVERARAVAAGTREDRFQAAFELCKKGLDTADVRRAIGDLVKHALTIFTDPEQIGIIQEAVKLAQKHSGHYPVNAFAYMDLAQCYAHLKKPAQVLEYAHKAMDCPGLNVRQKLTLLQQYLKLARGCYNISNDRKLLVDMLEQIRSVREDFSQDIETSAPTRNIYLNFILPHRIQCECALDMLAEADRDYALLPGSNPQKGAMGDLLEKTRERLKPKPAPEPEPEEEPALPVQPGEAPDQPDHREDEEDEEDEEPEEPEDETPVVPYTDAGGWDALKLTKKEVADYALGITGDERLAPMLAYLRVGADLNPQLAPLYHTVALAANDPMEKLDYSTTALITALADNDTDYPELNDLCMGAAFLRSSFLYGRDYDFSTQALRDSLAIDQQMETFRDVCDTLDDFRREAGRPIDIYAEYRNQDQLKAKEELEQTMRYAEELYLKYIITPPRDGAKFFRILKTKQIVFDKEGYLATMLRRILDRDLEGLEAEKDHFIATYLRGSGQLASMYISNLAVDEVVDASWEEAGRNMQMEKATASLQGDRRNNLRSNISDILRTILRWYVLAEQSSSVTWQTARGELAYARLRPVLLEQLERLGSDCDSRRLDCGEPQRDAGLFLLAYTARELRDRLDNKFRCGQENYLYADFLRSGHITLREDFMPELSATFCVLPEFNILKRIRSHVEEPRLSWQEQIDRIYGRDTTSSSYGNHGTAEQIADYLDFLGGEEMVTFPENREEYIKKTRGQLEIRYRGFLETYALAMNRGQIIKSDAFSYTLENTVRYWNAICRSSRNYGFLTQILHHAEDQIRTAARQYEQELEEQLEALISRNPQDFDKHPDYVEAIRGEIANQNFTVAEDWMARIRIGDFSLEVVKPQAVKELEHYFSARYIDIYKRVADASRSLPGLLGRREARNKDAKGGQQLIDNWIASGSAGTDRIRQLLNLLGWPNIQVTRITHPTAPRAELYQVTDLADQNILTAPQHPIAAFGSELEKPLDPDKKQQHMYVACLYGIYDCERLYDQMRTLDGIPGSKIFLLDYALSQFERRKLAQKLKERSSCLDNVNIVIDRVLITYLSDNYNENLINRTLMATAMPFSYCQPYVVDSIQTMPPEIFIGRKEELRRIERYDGVNLIYGGRQLGKSALFKKAVADLEGRNGQRAIRVDIKDLGCAAAAQKVSEALIDKGILPPAAVTDDWDVLCQNIKSRLRSRTDEISYFLLMLDEADELIKTSAACNYRPLVALKDVQETMDRRFKYVLAGLHNVVKFNRDVALGRNSVITHMSSLKITPFHTPEATELLTGPLSYLGFSLPNKVTVSQILATCNYFPGLIQLYAKKLIESVQAADYAGYTTRNSPPYVVTDDHLRRVMSDKDFVDTIYDKFEITLTLDEDQGSCYYPLALLIGWMYYLVPSKGGYTAREVLHYARDLHITPLEALDEEKIDALLQELQDLNILRSVSSDSYLLASKNFRDLLGSDEEINEKLTEIGGMQA